MGRALDRLTVSLATGMSGQDDVDPTQGQQHSSTLPFDVNDVIANVGNLSDKDVVAIDNAVDKERAARGIAMPSGA